MSEITANYDESWKEVIGDYFESFLIFFYPDIHSQINWENILIPIDGSIQSSIAIKRAVEMAKFYQSKINLLSVVNITAELYVESPRTAEELVRKTIKLVEEKKQEILTQDLQVDALVREGEPYFTNEKVLH